MNLRLLRASTLLAFCYIATNAQASSPFTVLSNNADIQNKKLYVELMYEKPACGDYKATFKLASKANPLGVDIPVDSFLNNPGTYETELSGANKYKSLMRPKAGGYRLRFDLPYSASVSDSFRICVESFLMAYRCVGCGAAGSDAIFGPQDIAAGCPYPNAATDKNLIACSKRESQAGNWEAWIYDPRDCQPYRMVQMGNGSWWMAQNLNWGEAGKCYNSSLNKCSSTEGRLYTWYEAITGVKNAAMYGQYIPTNANVGPQGVCPPGYHVPTEAEWSAIGSSTTNIKGLTNALDNWDLGGMREMRDSIGFSWRPTPVEAAIGAAGTAAKQGMMWTVPATWDNNYAISRATPLSNKNTWGNNITTADGKMGTKFDYLPARCVHGIGEAVKPDGSATLLNMGTVTINIASGNSTLAASQTAIVSTSLTTPPPAAAYKWIVTPVGNAPTWPVSATNSPDVALVAPLIQTTTDAVYNVRVVVIATGYTAKESNTISITVKGNCAPIVQGAITGTPANSCNGANVTLTGGNVSGGDNTYSYEWQKRTSNTAWAAAPGASNTENYSATAGNEVSYFRRVVKSCGGNLESASGEVALKPYPVIVQGALTNRSACPGTALYTYAPSISGGEGSGYNYTWLTQTTTTSTVPTTGAWSVYAGTVTNGAITPAASNVIGDYVWYKRVATSCSGQIKDTTAAAHLYTVSGGGLSQTDASAVYYTCPNTNLTVTLGSATGGNNTYSYRWYACTGGTVATCSIPITTANATYRVTAVNNSAITITSATANSSYTGYFIRRAFSCGDSVTTPLFRVYNVPQVYSGISGGGRFCPADQVTITGATPAVPQTQGIGGSTTITNTPKYQWQYGLIYDPRYNVGTFYDISLAKSANAQSQSLTIVLDSISNTSNSMYFRRLVTYENCPVTQDWNGTIPGRSPIVGVQTYTNSLSISVAGGGEFCNNEAVTLAATISGYATGYTLQWEKSSNGGTSWSNAGGGATTLSVSSPSTISTDMYRCKITSCAVTATSNVISVTSGKKGLTQALSESSILVNACGAGSIDDVTFGVSGGNSTYTYLWQTSTDATSWSNATNQGAASATIKVPYTDGKTQSDYYRRIVSSCSGSVSDTSKAFRLTYVEISNVVIDSFPTQYNAPASTNVKIEATVAAGASASYLWESSNNLVTWTATANTTTSMAIMSPSSSGTYSPYYRLKVTVCGTSKYSQPTRVYSQMTCPYKGADMVSGSCVQRTAGAKNWEAYITDARDNKMYRIAQMPDGNWWLAQNLNYTKTLQHAERSDLPNTYTHQDSTFGYYWCAGTRNAKLGGGEAACETYGAMYNWKTMMTQTATGTTQASSTLEPSGVQGICPSGWHIPSNAEWITMWDCATGDCASTVHKNTALGSWANSQAGKHLKSVATGTGTATSPLWQYVNTTVQGDDHYGFSVYPGGYRNSNGEAFYSTYFDHTIYYPTDDRSETESYQINFNASYAGTTLTTCTKGYGFYVRCVFDGTIVLPTKPVLNITSSNIIGAPADSFMVSTSISHKDVSFSYTASIEPTGNITVNSIPSTGTIMLNTSALHATDAGKVFKIKVAAAAPGYATAFVEQNLIVNACPYTATDLVSCTQRTTGGKNWEVKFKDPRDSKVYTAVRMPDGMWWQSDIMLYQPATGHSNLCGDVRTYKFETATDNQFSTSAPSSVQGQCAPGWQIPSEAQWRNMLSCVEGTCGSGFWTTVAYETNGDISRTAVKRLANKTNTESNYYGLMLSNPPQAYNGVNCQAADTRNATATLRELYTNYGIAVESNETFIRISNNDHTAANQVSLRCTRYEYPTNTPAPTATMFNNAVTANGQTVNFIAENIQGGVLPLTYIWDGAPSTNRSISKAMAGGNISTTLQVRDARGVTSSIITRNVSLSACPYTTADIVSNSCIQRADGARNWQAHITDERDSKVYRIVQMPDSRWWLAQNLDFRTGFTFNAYPQNGGNAFYCMGGGYNRNATTQAVCDVYGATYRYTSAYRVDMGDAAIVYPDNASSTHMQTICPRGWHMPRDREWGWMLDAIETENGGIANHSYTDINVGNVVGNGNLGSVAGMLLMADQSSYLNGENSDTNPTWTNGIQSKDWYGFSALPAGLRYYDGNWNLRGNEALFFSASNAPRSTGLPSRRIAAGSNGVTRDGTEFGCCDSYGLSIRCMKDY